MERASRAMFIRTSHGTMVAIDPNNGGLRQAAFQASTAHQLVQIPPIADAQEPAHGTAITSGALAGYTAYRAKDQVGYHFIREGYLLCAEMGNDRIVCDRLTPGPWERFDLIESLDS